MLSHTFFSFSALQPSWSQHIAMAPNRMCAMQRSSDRSPNDRVMYLHDSGGRFARTRTRQFGNRHVNSAIN